MDQMTGTTNCPGLRKLCEIHINHPYSCGFAHTVEAEIECELSPPITDDLVLESSGCV